MKKTWFIVLFSWIMIILSCCIHKTGQKKNKVWTMEKANLWYSQQKWITGCNFIPSNAINTNAEPPININTNFIALYSFLPLPQIPISRNLGNTATSRKKNMTN